VPEDVVEEVKEEVKTEETPSPPETEPTPGAESWMEEGKMPDWASRRFRESSEKTHLAESQLQEARTQMAEFQAQRDHFQRQVQGLTGAQPPSQQDAEMEEVRKILIQAIPGLEHIGDLKSSIEDINKRHWRGYANTSVDGVFKTAQTAMGLEELSPQSRSALEYMFTGFVNSNQNNKDRYEQGDPTLYADFQKFADEGMITPSRHGYKATTSRKARQAMPQGGGGGITRKPKEEDKRDMDQRIQDSWNMLEAAREESREG